MQKTILFLLLPPSSPLILVVTGFFLARANNRKGGKILVITGLLLLYLFSTAFISNLLIRPLENDYPPLRDNVSDVRAIVILTSGVKDLSHINLGSYPDQSSIARLEHGIEIYRQLKPIPVIISGGKGDPSKPEVSIGASLETTAKALGISADDLFIEDVSRNTLEGALQAGNLFKEKEKRIILVTSAFHMGRAVKFFREAGFDLIPAPTDYRGEKIRFNLYSFIPAADNMKTSSTAVYEYLCRLWYTLA